MAEKSKKTANSGRKKGTKNKNSQLVRLAMDNHGFDLVQALIREIKRLDTPKEKVEAMTQLLKYTYPTIKEIEIPFVPETVQTPAEDMSTEDLVKALKDAK